MRSNDLILGSIYSFDNNGVYLSDDSKEVFSSYRRTLIQALVKEDIKKELDVILYKNVLGQYLEYMTSTSLPVVIDDKGKYILKGLSEDTPFFVYIKTPLKLASAEQILRYINSYNDKARCLNDIMLTLSRALKQYDNYLDANYFKENKYSRLLKKM